jgi:hypothetical protein
LLKPDFLLRKLQAELFSSPGQVHGRLHPLFFKPGIPCREADFLGVLEYEKVGHFAKLGRFSLASRLREQWFSNFRLCQSALEGGLMKTQVSDSVGLTGTENVYLHQVPS